MHRKLITLFLLVSVLLVLGATTLAQDDVITVTWWVEDYVDVDLFNAAIAEPMKVNHPNIDLVITPQDLGTSDILRTSLAAGEAPDILQTPGAAFIAEFLQSGLIYDMTDAAEEFGWEDKLLPWAYQSGIIDGSLYSIPLTYESMVLIYNRTLFEEQGWEVPTNLSEMEAIAEQAIAAGINPFSYGNADWQPTNEHLMSIYFNNYAGPEAVYQALIGEKSWDSPEFVEATELLTTHIADNGWFSGILETYFDYIWDDFHTEVAQGDAAMMMIGTWGFRVASEFFAETDSEWDWAPLPVLSDNVQDYNYALATGSTLSVK
ncbi:MAG: extracellular solute-binding protein, partial [Chloroflexota bacterium]